MSSRISLRFVLVLFVGGPLLLVGFVQLRRLWQARHPAVQEHRAELVQAAARQMGCAADKVEIAAEEPTRARAQGCGKTLTFQWGRVRGKSLPEHWHAIDPNCTIDYLGCNLPCD